MAPTIKTEKSGSKEKRDKSGSKGDAGKSIKIAKAKETPPVAKIQEGESTSRTRSKKDVKASERDPPKASQPEEPDSLMATSTSGKKSRTKADKDTTSKSSKSGSMISHSNVPMSKKRAREEPEMESVPATSSIKRKKGDPVGDKTAQKQASTKKNVLKAPSASSDDSEEEVAGEREGDEAGEDEEVYLHGFSTDEDSSDEEDEVMDQDPLEVKNLPSKAKDDAEVKRRLDAAKRKPTADRGVLYIGRIPHGFYEEQMKEYFSQFGNVTRLRLARNKKTGKSKHYGFIEFDSSSVAQIVSETMNNYLLAGHLLQCKLIAAEKLHPELWVGSNKKWKLIPKGRIARLAHNKTRTPAQQTRAEERLLKRQAEKEAKLKAAGINYSLSKVGYTRIPA